MARRSNSKSRAGRVLSLQIAATLRRRILEGRYVPGQRLPSDRDMAQELNVSNITVAAARQELVNEGFLERALGSGTYVTDYRARQHVAILMDFDLANPRLSNYYLRIAFGAQQWLNELSIPSQLYVGHRQPEESPEPDAFPGLVEAIEEHRVRGLLVQAARVDDAWVAAARRLKLPTVGTNPQVFQYSVEADAWGMVSAGVDYLVQQGRRRIGLITFERPDGPKIEAFQTSIRRAGGEVCPEWIRGDSHPNSPGAGYQQFREIWTARCEKPDGLLITDDILFRDAMVAISESHLRVPRQLMVVTHANASSGIYCPFPVVKLEFDEMEIVRAGVDMLRALMNGQTPARDHVAISHRLVEPANALMDDRTRRTAKARMA